MIHFDCDYMKGAMPEVMNKLVETNMLQTPGYGADRFTSEAEKAILDFCGIPDGKVWLLEGGTQTNATVIDALLASYQGVVAAETAHINVHESGAIEASGHKVIVIPSKGGKIDAEILQNFLKSFYSDSTWPHMVPPGMVYISHPTELGTLYSVAELEGISKVCHDAGIALYMDGARLANALASEESDLGITDIARLCDVFYIGGTKCGALFGEAVVTAKPEMFPNFFTIIKRHGALLAKGRLLGVQFKTLFSDNLYLKGGRNALEKAFRLRDVMNRHGYRCFIDSPTNQQFFIMPNEDIKKLSANVSFELWGPMLDSETPVRFVTDWGTTDEEIDILDQELDRLHE